MGLNIPNLVFNPAVRAAAATYLKLVAKNLGSTTFNVIRAGGLLTGEVRYPANNWDGHTNDLWMYDPVALSKSPYPKWEPGTGTPAQAQAMLTYYLTAMDNYVDWLLKNLGADFSGQVQLLLPGFGIRPTEQQLAAADLLDGKSVGETGNMIASGLDWISQVKILHMDLPTRGVVYTTYLDSPTGLNTAMWQAPVFYLSTLAKQYGLPLAGENPGGGGLTTFKLCLARVKQLGMQTFMWMSEPTMAANTPSSYGAAVRGNA